MKKLICIILSLVVCILFPMLLLVLIPISLWWLTYHVLMRTLPETDRLLFYRDIHGRNPPMTREDLERRNPLPPVR